VPYSRKTGCENHKGRAEEAREEAERDRPGLTIFTGGSRANSGATGYAVILEERRTVGQRQGSHGL